MPKKANWDLIDANLSKALQPAPPKRRIQTGSDELISRWGSTLPEAEPDRETLIPEEQSGIPQPGIPSQGIPQDGIPSESIPRKSIPQPGIPPEGIPLLTDLIDETHGYYPTFNDISDRLIPALKLDVYEQAILLRLYRLTRGWKTDTCTVGLGALARQCVMARSRVQKAVASLTQRGVIIPLGAKGKDKNEGITYTVLPGIPAIPQKGVPPQGIPQSGTPRIRAKRDTVGKSTGTGSPPSEEDIREYERIRAEMEARSMP